MGQRECLECIKKEWITIQQIQEQLNIHSSSINESVNRLFRGGFIERKKNPDKYHGYLYKIKNEKNN
jgi:predicted transcriptional regulator